MFDSGMRRRRFAGPFGRRAHFHVADAEKGGGGAASGAQHQKQGEQGDGGHFSSLFCPTSLMMVSNGIYYYATHQCQSPYPGSSMQSRTDYTNNLGCGSGANQSQPRCQLSFHRGVDDHGGYEAALRTNRHRVDGDLGTQGLARAKNPTGLPVNEHFQLRPVNCTATMVGEERDYKVSIAAGDIYVRVVLILAVPFYDPTGKTTRAPVAMGVGQQLEKDPGSALSNELVRVLPDPEKNSPKWLQFVRTKDAVYFNVLVV